MTQEGEKTRKDSKETKEKGETFKNAGK